MACFTVSKVTFRVSFKSREKTGWKKIGWAPLMMSPVRTERWQFLAIRTLSPGPVVDATMAWFPTVVPFTRKKDRSAPAALAASSWASLITPVGFCRESTSSRVVKSMEKMRGPTNLRNRVDMPLPLLCPGV